MLRGELEGLDDSSFFNWSKIHAESDSPGHICKPVNDFVGGCESLWRHGSRRRFGQKRGKQEGNGGKWWEIVGNGGGAERGQSGKERKARGKKLRKVGKSGSGVFQTFMLQVIGRVIFQVTGRAGQAATSETGVATSGSNEC